MVSKINAVKVAFPFYCHKLKDNLSQTAFISFIFKGLYKTRIVALLKFGF